MTPRQFMWLRDRHRLEREYQELMWGIQTATLANHSFAQPKKPYKPYDFMPTKAREQAEAAPKKRWTRNSFAQQLMGMSRTMPQFVVKAPPKKGV